MQIQLGMITSAVEEQKGGGPPVTGPVRIM